MVKDCQCTGTGQRQWPDVTSAMTSVAERGGAGARWTNSEASRGGAWFIHRAMTGDFQRQLLGRRCVNNTATGISRFCITFLFRRSSAYRWASFPRWLCPTLPNCQPWWRNEPAIGGPALLLRNCCCIVVALDIRHDYGQFGINVSHVVRRGDHPLPAPAQLRRLQDGTAGRNPAAAPPPQSGIWNTAG